MNPASLPVALAWGALLFAAPASAATNDENTVVRRLFPEAIRIEEKTAWPDESAKDRIRRASSLPFDREYVPYRTVSGETGDIGYVFVDDVKGLHEWITFLAALNADGTLRAIEILAYRESHGFEIKQDRFRRQFAGKTLRDPIRVGTDIRNIAGATISTHAISAGVRRILAVYETAIRAAETRRESEVVSRTCVLWGTTLSIEVVTDTPDGADRAVEDAIGEVERLTPIFSRWDTASEISRVNRAAGTKPGLPISREFHDLVRLSMRMMDATDGCFDPTKRSAGGKPIHLFGVEGSVVIRIDPGYTLDLDGIAKGYAVDRVIGLLSGRGFRRALVNFGESSIAALGDGPEGSGWMISVRDARRPDAVGDSPLATMNLRNAVLSVSAVYERGAHIIDPFTGKPAPASLLTLVAGPLGPDAAAKADALSTACFVAGKPGLSFVRRSGFEGLWLGGTSVRTAGFSKYEVVK